MGSMIVARSIYPRDIADLVMPLLDDLARLRLTVLGCIAADPVQCVATFKAAGGTSDLFAGVADEDLMCVYVALCQAEKAGRDKPRDLPRDHFFSAKCARFLLKQIGSWSDDDDCFGGGYWPEPWTVKGLVSLFDSFYSCKSITDMHTRR